MGSRKEENPEGLEGRDEKGRFIEGNFFSRGLSNSGRPPVFNNWQAMADGITAYIQAEDDLRALGYKKQGKGIYSMEGLALHLGFASRESLYDYEKKNPEYSYIINRFRLFVTRENVNKLYAGATFLGAKLWLTNFGGYKEEITEHQNQTITQVNPVVKDSGTPLASQEDEV